MDGWVICLAAWISCGGRLTVVQEVPVFGSVLKSSKKTRRLRDEAIMILQMAHQGAGWLRRLWFRLSWESTWESRQPKYKVSVNLPEEVREGLGCVLLLLPVGRQWCWFRYCLWSTGYSRLLWCEGALLFFFIIIIFKLGTSTKIKPANILLDK